MLVVGQERRRRLVKKEVSTQGDAVPKVGKKHYPYTKKGKAAAKKAAKSKGKKVGYGR